MPRDPRRPVNVILVLGERGSTLPLRCFREAYPQRTVREMIDISPPGMRMLAQIARDHGYSRADAYLGTESQLDFGCPPDPIKKMTLLLATPELSFHFDGDYLAEEGRGEEVLRSWDEAADSGMDMSRLESIEVTGAHFEEVPIELGGLCAYLTSRFGLVKDRAVLDIDIPMNLFRRGDRWGVEAWKKKVIETIDWTKKPESRMDLLLINLDEMYAALPKSFLATATPLLREHLPRGAPMPVKPGDIVDEVMHIEKLSMEVYSVLRRKLSFLEAMGRRGHSLTTPWTYLVRQMNSGGNVFPFECPGMNTRTKRPR
jgi:hypothetical protein